MPNTRLEAFRAMVAKNPANALARFGLANEASKENLLDEALEHYQAYLASYDDEGNGYQRLADVLQRLGRTAEARDAVNTGIAAARRFGHVGMANELEAKLEELTDD
jgi:tetratricopeptide (TPR) repeat protein